MTERCPCLAPGWTPARAAGHLHWLAPPGKKRAQGSQGARHPDRAGLQGQPASETPSLRSSPSQLCLQRGSQLAGQREHLSRRKFPFAAGAKAVVSPAGPLRGGGALLRQPPCLGVLRGRWFAVRSAQLLPPPRPAPATTSTPAVRWARSPLSLASSRSRRLGPRQQQF